MVVEGRVTMEGAMDRGGFLGVRTCGNDVGVLERTGQWDTVVGSISIGRVDGFVGM